MKIFGIELSIDIDPTKVAPEALSGALDIFHEAIMNDPQVYSADIVSEREGPAFLLLGVSVADDLPSDQIARCFETSIGNAFRAASISPDAVNLTAQAPVKELVFV